MVENGSDVNACSNGYTALIHVIRDIEIVKYLIENGAKISVSGNRRSAYAECEKDIKRLEENIVHKKKGGTSRSEIEANLIKSREVLKYLQEVYTSMPVTISSK